MVETPSPRPRPGIDYPRTLGEFQEFFPDEEACSRYLERLRWPKGFVCPACGHSGTPWRSKRRLLVCPACERQTSVTAGTLFAGTRSPLRLWFLAAWEVSSRKPGASALAVQRTLGLSSYKTAWAWLQKFRRAMIRPNRDRLAHRVEVDECYVGGEEEGVRGRETYRKAIVAIAVELIERGQTARIRLRHVPDLTARSLVGFVTDVVEPGSTVETDGWSGYSPLKDAGFEHRATVLSASPEPAHVSMPHVHRVASLLKRWLLGTHQGGINNAHLPYYLDEFTFRFNRRTSRAR
ncbi:MAG: IS1595 family transposase, partial [Longimicrobiales bacterium]|nr:IS1595 family transposase [Longimicrobiales bacterium]